MATTADGQVEIGGLLMGTGTSFRIRGLRGLGTTTKTGVRQARAGLHGVRLGTQSLTPRLVTFNIAIVSTSRLAVGQALAQMAAAFAPSSTTCDIQWWGVPEGVVRFYGVPEGVDDQYDPQIARWIGVDAAFFAADPLKYGAAVASATIGGNEDTQRGTVTVVGSGGTPSIVNNTTGTSAIWSGALSGTRLIDLKTFRVTDGGGSDFSGEISTASTGLRFTPGANSMSVSGASVSYSIRPAYR